MKKNILILLALTAAFFSPALFAAPHMVLGNMGNDVGQFFIYWRSFAVESLSAGHFPLWNRYIFCGSPFAAEVQSALFYPLSCIFLLTGIARAVNLFFMIHVLIAGTGVMLMLRELKVRPAAQCAGALAFMFSFPLLCRIYQGHICSISAACWIGLLFLFLYRIFLYDRIRDMLFLAAIVAFQLLAGYLQYCYYAFIALFFYGLFLLWDLWRKGDRKRCGHFALKAVSGMLLGLALWSVQSVPGMELSRNSLRDGLSYEFCSNYSLSPENIITFLYPDFFGGSGTVPYWGRWLHSEMCGYFGIVPLLLALAAFIIRGDQSRKTHIWFCGALVVFFLIIALGAYTPLFRLFYMVVPCFKLFRGHSKGLLDMVFFLSLLAGMGMENLLNLGRDERKKVVFRLLLPLFIVMLCSFVLLSFFGAENGHMLWKKVILAVQAADELVRTGRKPPCAADDQIFLKAAFDNALFQAARPLIFIFLLGAALMLRLKNRGTLALLILILIGTDLLSHGYRHLELFDSRLCSMEPAVKEFLKKDPSPFRIISNSIPENIGMREKVENAEGYDAIYLKDYRDFINYSQGDRELKDSSLSRIAMRSPLLKLLNIRYLIAFRDGVKPKAGVMEKVFSGGIYDVFQMSGGIDRFFFVDNVEKRRHSDILGQLERSGFDPLSLAYVEDDPPFDLDRGSGKAAQIRLVSYGDDEVTLEVRNTGRGLLVLCDSFYPAWRVRVNGEAGKIYRTDYLFRGVFLKAGENRVEFYYVPEAFYRGAALSALASVVMLVHMAHDFLSRRKRSTLPCH